MAKPVRANYCPRAGDEALALAAKAVAHPARLAILRAIGRQQECNCTQICGQIPLAQSTVSQHLKVLTQAGLVRVEPEGPASRFTIDEPAVFAFIDALGDMARGLCAEEASCCESGRTHEPEPGAAAGRPHPQKARP